MELMRAVGGCYSLPELFARVGTSEMMATWLLYFEMVAEESRPPSEASEQEQEKKHTERG